MRITLRYFDYDGMVHAALLNIVKDTLRHVEKEGLPGENHFYITFRTDRPDVVIPDELRATHPEEITVVLQHQFWDLKVLDDHFEVMLSFQDRYEKVAVPFSALISFLDPSANFGLQFIPDLSSPDDEDADGDDAGKPRSIPKDGSNIISLDSFRKK